MLQGGKDQKGWGEVQDQEEYGRTRETRKKNNQKQIKSDFELLGVYRVDKLLHDLIIICPRCRLIFIVIKIFNLHELIKPCYIPHKDPSRL